MADKTVRPPGNVQPVDISDWLSQPTVRARILGAVNAVVNVPALSESAEARILALIYDAVIVGIDRIDGGDDE